MTEEDRSPDRWGHAFIRLLDVKGKKFRVYIDQDGEFVAHVNKAKGEASAGTSDDSRTPSRYEDEQIKAPSIEALRKRLLKAMASHRQTIRVPFWVYRSGHGYRYSTRHETEALNPTWVTNYIYGVHGSNDNALVEDEKGNREQWASYNSETFRGDMPKAVRERYVEIALAKHKLEIEEEKIEEEWKVNVGKLAKEAVEQVVGETA